MTSEKAKADLAVEQQRLRSQAYNVAEGRLREAHHVEFQKYLTEEYESRGLVYKPRLTEEEKARQTVNELLTKYPGLMGRVAPAVSVDPEGDGY